MSLSRTGDFGRHSSQRFCRQGYSSLNVLIVPRDFQHDTFVRETIAACENAALHPVRHYPTPDISSKPIRLETTRASLKRDTGGRRLSATMQQKSSI